MTLRATARRPRHHEWAGRCVNSPGPGRTPPGGARQMTNVPDHLRLCDEETSGRIADRIILSLAERVVGYLWTREQWGGDIPFDGVMEQIHRQVLQLIGWEAPDADRRDRATIIPAGVRRSVYERDDYRCVFCGERWDITIDHITARANGGTDDPENLQTLCRPCNSRKGAHQ